VQALVLAVDLVVELDGDESYLLAAKHVAATADLPVAVLSHVPSALDLDAAAALRAAGVPVLEGTRSGVLALGHLLDHANRDRARPVIRDLDVARQRRWSARLSAADLSGVEGFALLADYGIATANVRMASHDGAALAAASALGYPVVLKTDEGIAHKTDVEGVVVGLADDDELLDAYHHLAARLGPRVLVCQQVAPGTELLVGAVRDPNLGMLLVVGVGGVLVEQVADRAAALPPIDAARAHRLLGRTAADRLLAGPRGGAPADVDAVADLVAAFGQIVTELGDSLDAIEINPVICSPSGAIAVDVHLEVARSADRSGRGQMLGEKMT
jgi:acyl-CoA synthetase (NDP forming)